MIQEANVTPVIYLIYLERLSNFIKIGGDHTTEELSWNYVIADYLHFFLSHIVIFHCFSKKQKVAKSGDSVISSTSSEEFENCE